MPWILFKSTLWLHTVFVCAACDGKIIIYGVVKFQIYYLFIFKFKCTKIIHEYKFKIGKGHV